MSGRVQTARPRGTIAIETAKAIAEREAKEKYLRTHPPNANTNLAPYKLNSTNNTTNASFTKKRPTTAPPATTGLFTATVRPSTAIARQHQQEKEPQQPLQHQQEKEGIYNFTNDTTVYCFSDIESNMPDEIKDLMFSSSGNDIVYTPRNLKEENKAIVFTGDLIDRGAYTVRNLLNMLKLKEKETNTNNVILICGNRDINKIRMYHECYIEEIDEKILKGNRLATIDDIIRVLEDDIEGDNCRLFKNSGCNIAASINIQGIVNPHDDYKKINATETTPFDKVSVPINHRKKYDKNFKLSYNDDISRITNIYTKTLGSLNQIKFFNDEFNALFGKGTDLFGFTIEDFNEKVQDQFKDGIEDDPRYILLLKFIAMMNMVMGKNRKGNDLSNLPDCLKLYNGLYINYLEKCHIISKFTIGNDINNIYIASHSGIPYKAAATATAASATTGEVEGFFYIPDDVGIEPTSPPEKDNHIANIENINRQFNIFIKRILNDEVKYTDDEFKKYVAMGASCENTGIIGLTSIASPIVSSALIVKIRNESLNSLNTLNIAGAKKIYNIFGHQPSGFTPQINRVRDGGDSGSAVGLTSYHIDLDVSKAEDAYGISNKKSFVYLALNNNDNNMLVGKVESDAKYFNLEVLEKSPLKIRKTEGEKGNVFDYKIPLDDYCTNRVIEKILYGVDIPKPNYNDLSVHMFLVDDYYYGMFGYDLIKLPKSLYKAIGGGRASGAGNKTYAKSAKRFMNGKRQMVIYLGKRGGEYLKVKGEYMSLVKYIKIANKKKPTKK